jgi:hypothetical protein
VRKHAEWEPCALPSATTADSHAAAAGAEDAAARFTVIAHERAGAPIKRESRRVGASLGLSGNGAGGAHERAPRSGSVESGKGATH